MNRRASIGGAPRPPLASPPLARYGRYAAKKAASAPLPVPPRPNARQGDEFRAGFTLLEVMIAVGVLGVALLALLSLHHQDLRSIIRGQDLSEAAMLAQGVMTDAELERFPALGTTSGDFHKIYPGQYRNFRWRRVVTQFPMYPDVRQVEVAVLYGPGMSSTFTLVEFLYYPQEQSRLPARRGRSMPLGMQSGAPGQQ